MYGNSIEGYFIIQILLDIGIIFVCFILFKKFNKREFYSRVVLWVDDTALKDGRIVDFVNLGLWKNLEILIDKPSFENIQRESKSKKGLTSLNLLTENYPVKILPKDLILRTNIDFLFTTDIKRTEIARKEGYRVINLNEVLEFLKLNLQYGDIIKIRIVKKGEENQGIGYLDDGSMVVVKKADKYINREKEIKVTNILQTKAGRMVFGEVINGNNKIG